MASVIKFYPSAKYRECSCGSVVLEHSLSLCHKGMLLGHSIGSISDANVSGDCTFLSFPFLSF
jgi:hypothetical protein